jgi:hypothetical protein
LVVALHTPSSVDVLEAEAVLEVQDGWRLWRWRWWFLLSLWLFGLLDNSVRETCLGFLEDLIILSVVVSRIPQGVLRDLLFLLVSLGTCLLLL